MKELSITRFSTLFSGFSVGAQMDAHIDSHRFEDGTAEDGTAEAGQSLAEEMRQLSGSSRSN